jgi:Uma2 family endonuclease
MSEPYQEILDGDTCLRPAPGVRHETICSRLHARVSASLADNTASQLLPPRALIEIARDRQVRPDLALITTANKKLWLAVEIVNSEDHRWDTVVKKTIYEEAGLPRLWMIDPRYDNVEVYHGSEHGLSLKHILAGREVLGEPLLPAFQYTIAELFQK